VMSVLGRIDDAPPTQPRVAPIPEEPRPEQRSRFRPSWLKIGS
jgi:hypothetical protein